MSTLGRVFGLAAALLFVSACGGGGDGDSGAQPPPATTHSVATSVAGSGSGSISPTSRTVNQGSTTSFAISPAAGSTIAGVSGCGGTLDATLYTTAPVTAACTVTAEFTVDDNLIQLAPPVLFGAVLPSVPVVLRPGVNYGGKNRLDFELLVSPDQMEIDPRSGLISWTPTQADVGGIFNVELRVTDGTSTNSVAFAVRVANPTVLETAAESLPEGRTRVTVTEANVQLHGLQVILPSDYVSPSESNFSTGIPGVSLIDRADVPGGGDYSEEDVIRLTEFFRIDPVRASSDHVEIIFPDLVLPEGRHVEELVLYVYDRVIYTSDADSTIPVWIPVTYAFGLNDDGLASILTRATGALSFIGLEGTANTTDQSQLLEPLSVRQYVLVNPYKRVAQVPISCVRESIFVDRQLCSIAWPGVGDNDVCPVSGLTNCEARIRISGFRKNVWTDPSPDFSVHDVAGWAMDTILRFEALGLGYRAWKPEGRVDADIEIKIDKLSEYFKTKGSRWGFFNDCSYGRWYGDTPDVLYLQSNDGCQESKSVQKMATALAHEYMHHAQDRAGLSPPTFDFEVVAYSRHWLYEGTAVWFQDDVYDDVDFYRDYFKLEARILDLGLSARHDPKTSPYLNGYRRSGFFKLLQRTGTDNFGCDFETANAANQTFLAALFDGTPGDGGARLKEVMSDLESAPAFQCNFGNTFGQNNLMGNALEFYTHATLQMNDLSLLDHNEPAWTFEEPLPVVMVEPEAIASFRKERLPPLSSKLFFLGDSDGREGFKRELRVWVTPSDSKVLVSIRSSDGEVKQWFVMGSGPVVQPVGDDSLQDWVITFVNDDPASDLEVEFAVSRLDPPLAIVVSTAECTPPIVGQVMTCTVTGANLPVNTTFSAANCTPDPMVAVEGSTPASRSFTCTPLSAGVPVAVSYSIPGFVGPLPDVPTLPAAPESGGVDHRFAGQWVGTVNAANSSVLNHYSLDLIQSGSTVTGTIHIANSSGYARFTLMGTIAGSVLTFEGTSVIESTNPAFCLASVSLTLVPGAGDLELIGTYGPLAVPDGCPPGSTGDIRLRKISVLNDTGIDWCADGANNYDNGDAAYKQQQCEAVTNAGYPGQDGHHGRDAAARAGTLTKVGGGSAGFDFTKIANSGAELPASATLGSGPNDWACTRDNVTGLIWEMKTTDGGIHDRYNYYRWGGKTAQGSGYGTYYPDWNVLVDGSNNEALCGYSDWRVPTRHELQSIVNYNRISPAIDTAWFPNTIGLYFWSASPSAYGSSSAWLVVFVFGGLDYQDRGNYFRVRLVRAGE